MIDIIVYLYEGKITHNDAEYQRLKALINSLYGKKEGENNDLQ